MFDLFGFFDKPMRYSVRPGNGVSVSVSPCSGDSDSDDEFLILKFERKIKPSDLKDGKLLPISIDEVKRRGGKRSATILLSLEKAENLYKVLKPAIADARRCRFRQRIRRALWSVVITNE